jgi:hypothetical protein
MLANPIMIIIISWHHLMLSLNLPVGFTLSYKVIDNKLAGQHKIQTDEITGYPGENFILKTRFQAGNSGSGGASKRYRSI